MKKNDNQTINCSVHSCKHCNCDSDMCDLNAIKICDCNEKNEKEGTMCDSYKERK